ncbi:hypothetical protein JTB14_034524 [Gonioctena quinquepunctata]|nr:hypothetical protein JTB14_034524 [Gonioctena quinquepunctata]
MAAGIIGRVQEFSGTSDDWIIYSERLEQYYCENKIEDVKVKLATLISLEGSKVNTIDPEYNGKGKYVHFIKNARDWPINSKEIAEETKRDKELRRVCVFLKSNKWPSEMEEKLKPYYRSKRWIADVGTQSSLV